MAHLIDTAGNPLIAPSARPRSELMRGTRGITMNGWRPALRPIQDDIRAGWREAAARTIDLMQNVGWIAGALQQAVANTVGNGLRLSAQPDFEALGITEDRASALARQIERRWRSFTARPYECDIEGRRNFGQMQGAALLSYLTFGEIVAELPWRERAGGTWGTKVRLIEPWRLSQKSDDFNSLQQGVYQDPDGLPIAYLFEKTSPWVGTDTVRVPARDAMGRPRIVHCYDGAIGQVRGVSPLVPVLGVARQFDQLANATLMAAIVQSVFAATITSDTPTDDAMKALLTPAEQARIASTGGSVFDAWFDAQAGWYEQANINVGVAGRVAHLFPNQKLDFHTSETPNGNYKDHAILLLREMARALGITYESMTGDYAGVTFSSVRMETDDIYRLTMFRRQNIVGPFCQATYEAWLEEEIDRGWIDFPGGMDRFQEQRAEACRAEWVGSPKPQPDDKKLADSHRVWMGLGVMSAQDVSADLGKDYEVTVQQIAREKAMRKAAGIEEPLLTNGGGGPSSGDAPATKEDVVEAVKETMFNA